jgi:hypothetical protein
METIEMPPGEKVQDNKKPNDLQTHTSRYSEHSGPHKYGKVVTYASSCTNVI